MTDSAYRYGISSFMYQARRPFHPKRLFDLIHDKFILLQNKEQYGEDSDVEGADEDAEGEDDNHDANGTESPDSETIAGSDQGYSGRSSDTDMTESDKEDFEDELADKDFSRDVPVAVSMQLGFLSNSCSQPSRKSSTTRPIIISSRPCIVVKASGGMPTARRSKANGLKPAGFLPPAAAALGSAIYHARCGPKMKKSSISSMRTSMARGVIVVKRLCLLARSWMLMG